MAQYAALIYSDDVDWSAPEHAAETAEYTTFARQAGSAVTGGAALHPTSTATLVPVECTRGGDVLTTDGPYAETKEALTGFYLLEATDLDQAITLAAGIPAAWTGGAVEVRPVLTFG